MDIGAIQAAQLTSAQGSGATDATEGPTSFEEMYKAATHRANSPEEDLAEWLKKTPAQHMRDAILKEMGLTEEEISKMPPDKRAAVEATIAEKILERLQASGSNPQGQQHALAALVTALLQRMHATNVSAATETAT